MADLANVNGAVTPLDRACVPATDRAFLYGDGVYETLRTYGGRPFLLERHLERLSYSAGRLGIAAEPDGTAMAGEIRRTVEAAANPESLVRVVLSRGSGLVTGDPRRCPGGPNLIILVVPLEPIPERLYREGTSAGVVDVRRNPAGSLDPRIKSNNLLNNLLASMEAHRRGFPEGILLNLDGDVAEGSNANVFLVSDGELLTPSLDSGILAGITREIVLEIAREAGIPAREARVPAARLHAASEIFLTSTTRELLPVVRLDGRPVGDGRPGRVTRDLHSRYRRLTARAWQGDDGS